MVQDCIIITILMAVFNGEEYLSEQIESILTQTVKGWKLIIQDDCSTDSSVDIIKQYTDRYPDKIFFINRRTPSGSAKNNFFSMIKYVDTDYIMTCDQDDIWLPDKIEKTLGEMIRLEKKVGYDTPVLVHTDMKVVDSQLNTLNDSLFRYQRLNKHRDKLNTLLVQNIVTGCTLMINRALLRKIQKEPTYAIMHDWWFALIAAAFGCICFIDEPTVLYRQHKGNDVGAKNVRSLSYILKKITSVKKSPNYVKTSLSATYTQARCFFKTYKDELTENSIEVLLAYILIPYVKKIKRLMIIRKYSFWKSGLFRKIGQIVFT